MKMLYRRSGRRNQLTALLLGAAAALVLLSWSPQAKADSIVRPGSRPMFATFGFGPSISIASSFGAYTHTQMAIEQEFGYHFSGDGEGPATSRKGSARLLSPVSLVGVEP